MGQKVHPIGFRLGINKDWKSVWFYGKKEYREKLMEDLKIRKFLKERLKQAGLSSIIVERMGSKLRIILNTSRPGIVIGKKGAEIENLKKELKKLTENDVTVVIREVKKPEIDAQLVAENVAMQIERRVAFRRAMKKAVLQALKGGAQGIKIACSGRLAGAEMARTEWYIRGRVPLQTIRADIDYGFAEALTTYGIIGVKVWIFKGEIVEKKEKLAAGVDSDVNA
ncbi:30S ribosomal protein S3 [Deferribacter autotrophicus]|uniref:Small ribosomal subunit protein uS3 n=1 Tax=Deferribacter autotrophicus TaxID=500465 RepID=A0A5A8F381_9BACT|nr:30S ribosomal protein S3 [Deferribacter autotrophicus]KAA0258467.1 30S ribosomal protein S3 [Deferribacter autotrophicus]